MNNHHFQDDPFVAMAPVHRNKNTDLAVSPKYPLYPS